MNISHVKITLLLCFSVFLSGCCWSDYSDKIKELAIPIQNDISTFILTNKRAPNLSEKEKLLEKLDCKNIKSFYEGKEFYCSFKGKRFMVEWDNFFLGVGEDTKPHHNGYSIRVRLENSICDMDIYANGLSEKAYCFNLGCLQWQH